MEDQVRFPIVIQHDPSTGKAEGFQLLDLKRHGVEATVTPGGDLFVDIPEDKLEMMEATLWMLATAFSGPPLEQRPDTGGELEPGM